MHPCIARVLLHPVSLHFPSPWQHACITTYSISAACILAPFSHHTSRITTCSISAARILAPFSPPYPACYCSPCVSRHPSYRRFFSSGDSRRLADSHPSPLFVAPGQPGVYRFFLSQSESVDVYPFFSCSHRSGWTGSCHVGIVSQSLRIVGLPQGIRVQLQFIHGTTACLLLLFILNITFTSFDALSYV